MNFQDTPFCSSKSNFGKVETSDAQKLERLLNRIAASVDKLNDSPLSLLATMQEFSKNWKEDRTNYLG